jgi:hypothetical protein
MSDEWSEHSETPWRLEGSPRLRRWFSRGVQDGKANRPTYAPGAVRRYLSPEAAEAYEAGYEAGRQWRATAPRHAL